MNGHFQPPEAMPWQEVKTPDGRPYYYNTITKVTQWTKPEEMMPPAERALSSQPWKEYTAEGGKKYWYNTETKTSSWEMPDVFKAALGNGSATPVAAPAPASAPAFQRGNDFESNHDDSRMDRDRDSNREQRQLTFGNDLRAQRFVPASDEPDYATFEEAEAAFIKLLRRSSLQPDWTWEQALRAIVRDPQYRAIKDPRDRKAAYEKYCHDTMVQDKERAQERLAKLRADFTTMLKSHSEIKHYTRWKTARLTIEGETMFRNVKDENERRQFFEEYVVELKQAHREQQINTRKSAMDGLIDLLPKLNLEPYTRWADAQSAITSTVPFKNDEKYKTLTKFDILTVFQNHMKAVERAFNETKQTERSEKLRNERKAREGFHKLLQELKQDRKIKAGSKWSQIMPSIETNPEYVAMLGQSGSTPQELFWDVAEEEERNVRGTRNDVTDVLHDMRFEITPNTTFDDFVAVLGGNRRTANIDRDTLTYIFERLQEKKSHIAEDDRHANRQQRRAVDDLRSHMKHLDPPILISDTWEKVQPRLEKSAEYQAVTSVEARQGAFDKHIRRLKEKAEDADRDRQRRRDRSLDRRSRDDDRVRERSDRGERGERSHRSSGRIRTSRSPELDSYEADRRKAIEARERNHRKSSMAETLLSDRRDTDGFRERDRDYDRDRERDRDRLRDRDRERDRERPSRPRDIDYDRPPPSRREEAISHYDRERRDRDEERERIYRRRVVEKDVDDLNYGDEKPSAPRRRRPEEADQDRRDSRDSKRLKRDHSPRERSPNRETRTRARSPQPLPPKDDLAGVHSGSEEGEIEED